MFRSLARLIRATITGVVVVGCADGNPPTQPVTRAAATLPTASAAAAEVSVQSTPTTIYACYMTGKGDMYRIKTADTPAACDKKDIEFSWTDSPSGAIPGIVFAATSATLPADGRFIATCPAGKSVLNFGPETTQNTTGTWSQILSSRPTLSAGKLGWVFRAAAGTTWVFYWTCVDAAEVTSVP